MAALSGDIPLSPSPGSTASLRAANQRRVLRLLQHSQEGRPLTQAEIARATQLAPATVSNIVRDLVAAGLVETEAGAGRRGTLVRISRRAGLIAGVDVGHRHVRVAIGDLTGAIVAEAREPIEATHDYERGIAVVETLLGQTLAQVGADHSEVLAIGLGLPAPIGNDGLVVSSSILPGWVGVDVVEVLPRALGKPVFVDNDANLGALAEYHRGAGVGQAFLAYVKVSSGVGAGLIVDGRIFRGGAGTAGEIGHLTIDEAGPICRCGSRGCLEAYCSVGLVHSLLAERFPGATFVEIVAAAVAGDIGALRVFEDVGQHLGWGIAMLVNLLSPTCIIVGGDMARAGTLLLEPVGAALRRHALSPTGFQPDLRIAKLGDRSPVVGALLLALQGTELATALPA